MPSHSPVHRLLRTTALVLLLCVIVSTSALALSLERKVLIVGIDGMRADALLAANTPNLDALIAGGSVSRTCQSEDITLSGPCWATILTGVHRNKHLVVDNTFTPNDLAHYPHFFTRLRGACPDVLTASIVHWAPVNNSILQGDADVVQTNLSDDAVRDACIQVLAANTASLIFLHFDDVDHAGHTYGFSPSIPEYIAKIEEEDARVGQIVAAIHSRPTYANEDWLVVVTSDHGGSGTSHGQNIPEHLTTALIVSGASSAIGTVMPTQPTLADVAPTVMTFLGVPIDPTWGWDGNAVGLNMSGSPSQPVHCSSRCVLLSETFESVPLGPTVNEAAATGVWSGSPPTGWTVDDSGVPGVNDPNMGVTEWEGWAIARKDWWISIAADQNRSQFTRAIGSVAVADSDEHDDRGTPAPSTLGPYDAHLATPAILLAGITPGSVQVTFDSSWRYEGIQRALLTARFDGGPPVSLLDWRSQAGTQFKPDATNEAVRVSVPNPSGAAVMSLDFALLDARNNWWWAIDNVVVDGVCQRQPSSFCLGDGTDRACPCNNPGTTGRGCDNTTATGGAKLVVQGGTPSVGADTLQLSVSGAVPFSPGLYYEGSTTANPTAPFGVTFGNGLRCAGGTTNRLEVQFADGVGASSTTVSLSGFGAAIAGHTYYYQQWYRDTGNVGTCTPGFGFNLSNALSLTWLP